MHAPKYSYPPGVFAAFARDVLLLRRRDFHQDAQVCLAGIRPPVSVSGQENIPQRGPCVITVNHYHRKGFGIQWLALAVAATVPVNMHWIMTGKFTYPGKWYAPLGTIGSKLLLERIAHVYSFATMPPMPPRDKDVKTRAASIRTVLDYVMCSEESGLIVGLAPEGYDANNAGVLTRPFPGVGRFGLLLSKTGLKFVPVGAYEADGYFHIRFGEAYQLKIPGGLSHDEMDQQASQIIMENIARQLPVSLRGEFK